MSRARCILVFLCLAVCAAFGQMGQYSYTSTPSISYVSNFQNCAGSTGVNCFHVNAAAPEVFAQIFSSNNVTLPIDASGVGWRLTDYPNFAWVKHSEWGTVYGLQADSTGTIWGLVGSCGGSGHIIAKWTGSAWSNVAGCFTQFVLSQDGQNSWLAIDLNGAMWLNGVQLSQPEYGVGARSVAILGGAGYGAVLTDNTFWVYASSAWTEQSLPVGAESIGYDNDQNATLYMVGTDGSVYYNTAGSWGKMVTPGAVGGGYGQLANGGSGNVWIIGPTASGNNIYRYSDVAIRFTQTLTGSATCPGCFPRVYHNASQSVSWGSAHAVTHNATMSHFDPQTQLNLAAYSDLVQAFDCFEQDSCAPTDGGEQVLCSEDGLLNIQRIQIKWSIEFNVKERTVNTGQIGGAYQRRNSVGLFWYTNYGQAPACSNTSTPDLNSQLIETIDYNLEGLSTPSGWDMFALFCVSDAPVGSRVGTWFCPKEYGEALYGPVIPNYCTLTP